ncbi:hypothetical protein [Streptomyces sp. NPDC058157]
MDAIVLKLTGPAWTEEKVFHAAAREAAPEQAPCDPPAVSSAASK